MSTKDIDSDTGGQESARLALAWVDLTDSDRAPDVPKLIRSQARIDHFGSLAELRAGLTDADWDAVVFDFDFPERDELVEIAELQTSGLSTSTFILTTLFHSESLAVWALRNRFFDYFIKPADREELKSALERLLQLKSMGKKQSRRRVLQSDVNLIPEMPKARRFEDRVARALTVVENSYESDLKNSVVAEACGLNEFRFSKLFKERFGVGFKEYLTTYRLCEARRMLSNPAVSVTEVCYAVGFNDPSYFTRVFRKHLGMSPSDCIGLPVDGDETVFQTLTNMSEK